MISKVINFIAKLLEVNAVTKNLIILLKSYQNITKILSITRINDKKKYNNQRALYKLLIAQLKHAALETILAPTNASETVTKNENYYVHVLINYTPTMIDQTYEQYGFGLGIFSMQDIERRNKESKNCAHRFSNHKYNLCISTIGRLFDIFFFGGT